ncbi:MAG: phage tail protein [Clostridiales bacterium]|nr:phage tail protein [Clostridiales bacterium]
MYGVYADGVCIYSDKYTDSDIVNGTEPTLELKDNAAGTFTITLPVGNPGYDSVTRLVSEIIVKRDNEEIWAGRVINEETDFYNSRKLTCEGELAYLNDVTVPPQTWENAEIYDFLEDLLHIYCTRTSVYTSSIVDEVKRDYYKLFSMGTLYNWFEGNTVTFTSNYETVLDIINSQLIDVFGGHLKIRRTYRTDGICVRMVDYMNDDVLNTNPQQIRFGKNLLDFTRNWDLSDFVTVVLPRGAKDDSTDEYLDVSEVNDNGDDIDNIYVINEAAVSNYGWIETVIDWEDVTDAEELLELAQAYLTEEQFDEMTIEVSAIDLRYLSSDYQAIDLLDQIRVISNPHGLDKLFPVTEVSIQLDKPENSTYVLNGTSEDNFTSSTRSTNDSILSKINNLTSDATILEKAQANATEIHNRATMGYVTIISNSEGSQALYISSEPATTAYDVETGEWNCSFWVWNVNGLGFFNGSEYNAEMALTSDGAITANYITVGTMSADRVRTGKLTDENNNVVWDLDQGELTIRSGTIALGLKSGNASEDPKDNYYFYVDGDGNLKSESGEIGGFTITSNSIYNSHICLQSEGLDFLYDGETLGTYGTSSWQLQPSLKGMITDIEYEGDFIAWAHKDSTSHKYYSVKLGYAAEDLYTGNYICSECGAMMEIDLDTWQVVCPDCGHTDEIDDMSSDNKPKKVTKDRVFLGTDLDGAGHTAHNLFIDWDGGGFVDGLDMDNTYVYIPYYTSNPQGSSGDLAVVKYFYVQLRNGVMVAPESD